MSIAIVALANLGSSACASAQHLLLGTPNPQSLELSPTSTASMFGLVWIG